jgi:Tfp pilus assembly protein PilN
MTSIMDNLNNNVHYVVHIIDTENDRLPQVNTARSLSIEADGNRTGGMARDYGSATGHIETGSPSQ